MKAVFNGIRSNWERAVFSAVGLFFFYKSIDFLLANKTTDAGIVLGFGFLSFIFSNSARFKRFKGLGFEAEFWEDKKKEAAALIEKLREVVSIYTNEIVLGSVKSGRFSNKKWSEHWALYDKLNSEHKTLGQDIDFSNLKKAMDDYYLFDMTMHIAKRIRMEVINRKEEARRKIEQDFGTPIKDVEGYNQASIQLMGIEFEIKSAFEIACNENLAGHVLEMWKNVKIKLKDDFDIEANISTQDYDRLQKISLLFENRPVIVTAELNIWADRED